MRSSEPVTVNEPAFWDGLYERGGDRWELRRAAPSLAEYLRRAPLPRGNVAVLGCGRGHDARLLARLGHRVWGFDFAARAIQDARALAKQNGLEIAFEQRDLFDLATDFAGFFDGIWEYTCFCAIDPNRRAEYVRLVRTLLKPDGWLLACFWPLGQGRDGPPFPATEAEIRRLFAPDFVLLETYVPTESAARRLEWMVVARPHAALSGPTLNSSATP
ncbi:MAG: methyltransferase domain-containing protein [Candidatus Methylomirabilia bacterium]